MDRSALDFRDRAQRLARLDGARFDVAIIGGGVTGAGVARDAAMRGLSVALFEARDFASGTSSRSSKMIHGGLRYMAQGDVALVQEAATERMAVERIAPHLTRQTPFVMPAKTAAVAAKLRAGLWAFEKLGSVPKDRRHEVWSRRDLETREPAVDARETVGAIVYPEYLTDDSKLTLANVRDAHAHGAAVLSYAPVTAILTEGGRATGLEIGDSLAGGGSVAQIKADVVINAAGPWVDAVRRLESDGAPPRLQLTKGIHLVVDHERLPVSRTVIMPAADRRSVFAVPTGAFTYIGTTDTFYPDSDYEPRIEPADVDYLLAAAAVRFATPRLTYADLVSAWSGVRPLVAQAGKSASDISRKDEVWTGPAGVLAIAGGKLTAYRRMAERIVDQAETALGRTPRRAPTEEAPLPGGDLDPKALTLELTEKAGSEAAAARLVGLYGSEAALALGGPAGEARHAVLSEGALTLEDWWVRRSARARFDHQAGVPVLPEAAAVMGELLGWSAAEIERQVAHCRRLNADLLSALPAHQES